MAISVDDSLCRRRRLSSKKAAKLLKRQVKVTGYYRKCISMGWVDDVFFQLTKTAAFVSQGAKDTFFFRILGAR